MSPKNNCINVGKLPSSGRMRGRVADPNSTAILRNVQSLWHDVPHSEHQPAKQTAGRKNTFRFSKKVAVLLLLLII